MMKLIQRMVGWARRKSPWILHFNTGACNACDIEIIAALTPQYDLERFGVLLKGTPRHADVLLCSGPVTRQIQDRLVRIYEQMPEPKFVVAIGTCSCSGGVFQGCYNVKGGIDTVLPVAAYIPGCPASPSAIIDGCVKLLKSLEEAEAAPPAKPSKNQAAPQAVLAPKT
ncbi:MAG: NADH-quinone oxidoreductase subunit B family protein [Phycisphaerae bacterium]|jgi:NADH-quinone oxidoreductase B subunit